MKNLASRILSSSLVNTEFSTGSCYKKFGIIYLKHHDDKHIYLECLKIKKLKINDVDVAFGANFCLKQLKLFDVQKFELYCRKCVIKIL